MKIKKICIICNIVFDSYDVGRRQFQKCCSKKCRDISLQGKKLSTLIIENCKTCDSEFEIPHYSSKKYCSKKCQHISLKIYNNATQEQKLQLMKIKYDKFVIKKDGCWNWNGATQKGYGCFNFNKKTLRAHRASWIIHFGDIPKGKHILHKCDNPACTNPQHLFLGSHKDNMIDMRSKGHHKQYSKLNEDEVKQIKSLINMNVALKEIAERFKVKFSTIYDIKSGATWKKIAI